MRKNSIELNGDKDMFEIVTILGLIYLLYRIRFFYKEGNYNQVKGFVSIFVFIITVLVVKQLYDYKFITFEVYYNISLVVGLLFYLLVIGTIVYKYKYADNKEEKKELIISFILANLPILIFFCLYLLIF